MTAHHWDKVAQGRYATTYLGHTLQAIRTEDPYHPEQRPYIAVVDRVPLEPGEWSLNRAKTKAVQFVERQNGKLKAERLFTGARPPAAELLPFSNQNTSVPEPEPPVPEPEPPESELPPVEPELPPPEPEPEPAVPEPEPAVPEPEPAVRQGETSALIFATLLDPNTLSALNILKETLSLMREVAEVKCTVSLPPTMEL
jgi:hypothetical protein